MDCSFATSAFNFSDIFNCTLVSMGIPYDFVVIGILAIFVLFAAISRLDFDFSLGGAFALTWALTVIGGPYGNSLILQYLMGLLILGVGLRILMAMIKVFKQ